MISYKLAKQLKEAGWSYHSNGEWINEKGYSQEDGVGVYIPTLSELIEAVQEINNSKDFHLEADSGGYWQVSICVNRTNPKKPKTWKSWIKGKSPEEAVAKLWIKLNKK